MFTMFHFEHKHDQRTTAWEKLKLRTWDPPQNQASGDVLLLVHAQDIGLILEDHRRLLSAKWRADDFMKLVDSSLGSNAKVVLYTGGNLDHYVAGRGFESHQRVWLYPKSVETTGQNCDDSLQEMIRWASSIPNWRDLALEWFGGALACSNVGEVAIKAYIAQTHTASDFPFRKTDNMLAEVKKLGSNLGDDIERWSNFFSDLSKDGFSPSHEVIVYLRNQLLSKRSNGTPPSNQ